MADGITQLIVVLDLRAIEIMMLMMRVEDFVTVVEIDLS